MAEITPNEKSTVEAAIGWRKRFWTPINSETKNFDSRAAEELAAAVDRVIEERETSAAVHLPSRTSSG